MKLKKNVIKKKKLIINLKSSNSKEKLHSIINWILMSIIILSTIGFTMVIFNREQNQHGFTPEAQFWAFMLVSSATLAFFHVLFIDIIHFKKEEKKSKKKQKSYFKNPKLTIISKFFVYSGIVLIIQLAIISPYYFILIPYEYLHNFEIILWISVFFGVIGVVLSTIGLYMIIYKNAWEEKTNKNASIKDKANN